MRMRDWVRATTWSPRPMKATRRLSHLKPMLAIVTNIDADHMSTYDGDIERLAQWLR